MGRPVWQVKLIKKMWPTRYASAKAARFGPVGDWVRDHFLLGDRMTQIPINQEIQGVEPSMALPLAILEDFVREASTRVIMHQCICRDNNRCRAYPRNLGCVFLGDAARDINPALGKQAGVEETLGHIRDAVASGLVPFTGRNKLDSVWLGVGPEGRLLTICLCCPCCCLYGVFPHLPEHLRKGVVRMEGLEVEVTGECTGCGSCSSVCLSQAISLEAGRARIDAARCIGCGRCAAACPERAIELRLTRPDAVELLKKRIRTVVEVR
jgi:ferredoxin